MTSISLSELNALVRDTLHYQMPDSYWVVAEIASVSVRGNGHCYLEFVERDPHDGLVAKASAHIWRNTFTLLRSHFERATGQTLAAGMKVLVEVEVDFHEVYGYSLNILDIDPTYTMGDMARRRQEILEQLREDGVLEMNKALVLPRPLSRIAVISSETAAGYGGFCNQMNQKPYKFTLKLFPAIMQGNTVENSVIAALEQIAAEEEKWDAVAIIRGGGAVSDLNGFDSYLLAANVAQFPLPILTGIGHERDDTVIDFVAHTRLKTPTAVAAFLLDAREKEIREVEALEETLQRAATLLLRDSKEHFQQLAHRFQLASEQFSNLRRERLLRLMGRLELLTQQRLQNEQHRLELIPERITAAIEHRLEREDRTLKLLEQNVRLASPERILKLGFSITTLNGKAVRKASQLKPGDRLQTQFEDGAVSSIVE